MASLVVVLAVLASDRAPGVIDEASSRVAERVERELSDDARARASAARDRLEGHEVPEEDALAHVGLWMTAMVLVGLASWSWRSLLAAAVLVAAISTGMEAVQEVLAPSRLREWSDVFANLAGISFGVVVVVAVNVVVGLPARRRRSASTAALA